MTDEDAHSYYDEIINKMMIFNDSDLEEETPEYSNSYPDGFDDLRKSVEEEK